MVFIPLQSVFVRYRDIWSGKWIEILKTSLKLNSFSASKSNGPHMPLLVTPNCVHLFMNFHRKVRTVRFK